MSSKNHPVQVAVGPPLNRLLKLAYRSGLAVLLEGQTGIGKSEIVVQVARELGIGCTVLDLSLLEPPDLVGLPIIADGRTSYAPPSILPLDGRGILMLEELNRAERHIQQCALQLLTARRLHDYTLPPGWVPFAAVNPEGDQYHVTPLDPALRVRFLNVAVRADRYCWLEWARANGIHWAVLRLAEQHDELMVDTPPRSWKYASDLLHHLAPEDVSDEALLYAALSGYLSRPWVEVLIEELRRPTTVDGMDLVGWLATYHRDGEAQKRVRELAERGRTDMLAKLVAALRHLISSPDLYRLADNQQFALEAFEKLVSDLPGDHRDQLTNLLGYQPIVAKLLPVRPEHILDAQYPGSWSCSEVAKWVGKPALRHRVQLLVRAVCRFIETYPDISILRQKSGAMHGLRKFYQQVKGNRCWKEQLDELCRKYGLPVDEVLS